MFQKIVFALFATVVLSATSISLTAQDIHFSQFFQSPLLLNPALCGEFEGSYRLGINQRTQWRSVTTPFSTVAVGADANHITLPDGFFNRADGDFKELPFNGGISVYSDKAGDSQLRTTGVNLMVAQQFKFSSAKKTALNLGAMMGYTSMKIDYSKLTTDSQWNGTNYDPNQSNGEIFPRAGRGYFNLNVGATLARTIDEKSSFSAGISLYNLSRPKQSFFDEGYVKLDSRFNLHGSYKRVISTELTLEPMMLLMVQGKYTEFNIGGLAHYTLSEKPWARNGVYAGLFVRAKDSGFFIVGLQHGPWNAAVSYDLNTSSLKPASNGRGGLEISLLHTFSKFPRKMNAKTCPNYM